METIQILDSTLRDGAQAQSISFTVADKLSIIKKLDSLGVSYIEAGNPASNPKDIELFNQASYLNLSNSSLVAFTSTRKPNQDINSCSSVFTTLNAKTPVVSVFGKSSVFQVTQVLKTSKEENLKMIFDTIDFFVKNNREVIFDAEHFFDGFLLDKDYALLTLLTAQNAGATSIALCDTNGATFPEQIYSVTKQVVSILNVTVGIHCHNDIGCAVANSLMAVNAGARQLHGTYLGFGERCGNANLSSIIPSLQMKKNYYCIPESSLKSITKTARYIAEISNITLPSYLPYVGTSAFAHKGGMHVDAVVKNSQTFEHITPESVGNKSSFLISEVGGKSAVLSIVNEIDSTITKSSPQLAKILEELKKLEFKGYIFETATASLELLIRRKLCVMTDFFELVDYKLISEHSTANNMKNSVATVQITSNSQTAIATKSGDGPVHALDNALRQAVQNFFPTVKNMHLVDYKVRVIEPQAASAAMVRVLVESTDGETSWTTVGVSKDIIRASFYAIKDSVLYKLVKDSITKKNN